MNIKVIFLSQSGKKKLKIVNKSLIV
jgi:hypothetical protein